MRREILRREIQLTLDPNANHRALRRCFRCGSYARPYDEVNGAIRCERCAQKDRRDRDEEDEIVSDRPAGIIV
jgi:hypothetical protein